MKWTEPTVEDIATKEVIFYSPKFRKVCIRICKDIGIDVFPDIDAQHYWKWEEDGWNKYPISGDFQTLSETEPVFSRNVMEKLNAAPSNILLLKNEAGVISGILHFFDFQSISIYQALYRNFFLFEGSLRQYLSELGYTYEDVKAYYQHKEEKEKNQERRKFYRRRIDDMNGEKFQKEARNLKNFQKLEFRELVLFSISSTHKKSRSKQNPKLDGIQETKIADLRNTIMHSKDNTGASEVTLHDLESFNVFFDQVQAFKNAFQILRKQIQELLAQKQDQKNTWKLKSLSGLNDEQLRDYFFKSW